MRAKSKLRNDATAFRLSELRVLPSVAASRLRLHSAEGFNPAEVGAGAAATRLGRTYGARGFIGLLYYK